MDTQDFVKQIVNGYLETEAGQKAARKAVEGVISDAINTATGYQSEFRKQVVAAMTDAVQLPQGIKIESYNDAILKIVRAQVEHATRDAIERQVAERMKDLLTPVPAEIKLSELAEQYRKHLKEQANAGCVCHGESRMTFLHQTKGDGFDYYYFDRETHAKPHECEMRFGVYSNKLFTLTFRDSQIEKELFVGPLYGFQRLLFQLKAAQAKIVIDCTPDDVDLNYGEEYD